MNPGTSYTTIPLKLNPNGGAVTIGNSASSITISGALYEPTVTYTTVATHTPAAGTKFINVDVSGTNGWIYIDLDNLEYTSNGSVVYVSAEIAASGTTLNLVIRNSANATLLSTYATISTTKEISWMLTWDAQNNRWNSVELTTH